MSQAVGMNFVVTVRAWHIPHSERSIHSMAIARCGRRTAAPGRAERLLKLQTVVLD